MVIRLPTHKVGMIVDRGNDFPADIQSALEAYGSDMWLFRDDQERVTTRAANIYRGDNRGSAVVPCFTPLSRLKASSYSASNISPLEYD